MTLTKIAAAVAVSGAVGLAGFGVGGPAYYGPPQACVNATGPYGYASGSLCI